MRPSKYCPKFLPWIGTNRGEIDDVCIDEVERTTKKCNDCIGHPERKDEEKKQDINTN
jgi:hypothetical protein